MLFFECSYNDVYKDFGYLIYEKNDLGVDVLKVVGGCYFFLCGNGVFE